jgi:hypothetical protein
MQLSLHASFLEHDWKLAAERRMAAAIKMLFAIVVRLFFINLFF